MKSETTFIYALCEPYPNQHKIRYVGKADDPYWRYEEHCRQAHKINTHKNNWIKKLQAQGLAPQLEVLEEIPKVGWQEIEREYIRVFRAIGFQLTNLANGGQSAMDGRNHTPESIEKMRKARLGKRQSPEHAKKGALSRVGLTRSLDARSNISSGQQGVKKQKNTARSCYVGVTWRKRTRNWAARISFGGKRRELGEFKSEESAAQAYNKAALALFGPNAKTNLPKESSAVA